MSATILAFPASHWRSTAERRSEGAAPIPAASLARKFTDHFLPIVQASVDLFEADERDFEARCRRMLDVEGAAMIDELCGEFEIVGRQMQLLVDGLELTRGRLRAAVARLTAGYADPAPERAG